MRNNLSTFLPLQELSPFPKISIRVPRWRLFQRSIDISWVCPQNVFMSDTKDSAGNFMGRWSICCDWFYKKCMSIGKKSFLQKINIKNRNAVTANCNFYTETLNLWNFFVFFWHAYGCLVFYNELLLTEAHGYRNKWQPKSVPKSSYL